MALRELFKLVDKAGQKQIWIWKKWIYIACNQRTAQNAN